jgi:MOSC domain-containing protein YiiM
VPLAATGWGIPHPSIPYPVGLLGDTAGGRALAGDQLYVDLDISHENLPAGGRIAVGADAVLEVTVKPHTGCRKLLAHLGDDALAFVNSDLDRQLRLRGLHGRVVHGGVVRPGDVVRRIR